MLLVGRLALIAVTRSRRLSHSRHFVAATEEWALPTCWSSILATELESERHAALREFIAKERSTQSVYPSADQTLRALREVGYDDVKVVILGQDPYHNQGQADGLAFSSKTTRLPPSLRNIFEEISRDIGYGTSRVDQRATGDLSVWAAQGVLLLNTLLTVRAGEPMSHAGQGWEDFTDAVIGSLVSRNIVVLAWGSHARKKIGKLLTKESRAIVLETSHPSPLSAHRGFYGSNHFSKANDELCRIGVEPIDWTCALSIPAVSSDQRTVEVEPSGVKYGTSTATGEHTRINLSCPYSEKDEAKARGARWDPGAKTWYILVPQGGEATARVEFARWLPQHESVSLPLTKKLVSSQDRREPKVYGYQKQRLSDRPIPF